MAGFEQRHVGFGAALVAALLGGGRATGQSGAPNSPQSDKSAHGAVAPNTDDVGFARSLRTFRQLAQQHELLGVWGALRAAEQRAWQTQQSIDQARALDRQRDRAEDAAGLRAGVAMGASPWIYDPDAVFGRWAAEDSARQAANRVARDRVHQAGMAANQERAAGFMRGAQESAEGADRHVDKAPVPRGANSEAGALSAPPSKGNPSPESDRVSEVTGVASGPVAPARRPGRGVEGHTDSGRRASPGGPVEPKSTAPGRPQGVAQSGSKVTGQVPAEKPRELPQMSPQQELVVRSRLGDARFIEHRDGVHYYHLSGDGRETRTAVWREPGGEVRMSERKWDHVSSVQGKIVRPGMAAEESDATEPDRANRAPKKGKGPAFTPRLPGVEGGFSVMQQQRCELTVPESGRLHEGCLGVTPLAAKAGAGLMREGFGIAANAALANADGSARVMAPPVCIGGNLYHVGAEGEASVGPGVGFTATWKKIGGKFGFWGLALGVAAEKLSPDKLSAPARSSLNCPPEPK